MNVEDDEIKNILLTKMNSEFFTPRELFDILIEKLQPTDDDYYKIFQMVGDYAYERDRKSSRWNLASQKFKATQNTDVALHTRGNHLSDDQRLLLRILGITFLEKGSSFLMLNDTNLKVKYWYAYPNDILQIENTQGIFQTRGNSPLDWTRLTAIFDESYIREIQHKFYQEHERLMIQMSYNALSATLPNDSLITESLPLLVLYQMLEEERIRK